MNHTSISATSKPSDARTELARRLFRLSLGVRAMVLIGTVTLLAWWIMLMLAPTEEVMTMLQHSSNDLIKRLQGDFTGLLRWRLVAAFSLPVLVGLGLLWQLWCLFGHFQHGQVLVPAAVQRLRQFGRLLVVLALAGPLSHTLSVLAVSWDNPPGQRQLELAFSSQDYTLLLLALVFVAVARVMAEAVRAAEENDGFV